MNLVDSNNNLRNNSYYSSLITNPLHNNQYVKSEINKTSNSSINPMYSFIITALSKTYKTICSKNSTKAVNNLHLALEKNEKFGLMGFNGSGKTTTFKSITDEISFEEGNIKLFGKDTLKDFNLIRKNMGYCPQSNALFDYLTVEETFEYYLKLKRSRGEKGGRLRVNNMENLDDNDNENNNTHAKLNMELILQKFGLEKFRRTITNFLSGGNKRKLNFAIALMNNPQIILLDEPSTGVDPESRRTMWRNINDIPRMSKNFNMILSTHSMEEAEILCDTIGWMKEGNFVCVGNPEKLKLQFSQGYYLHIIFKKQQPDLRSTYEVNLRKVEEIIAPLCEKIMINGNENVDLDRIEEFELVVNVGVNQGALFAKLLTLKSQDECNILEINLSMQSLENILTSL